MVALNRTKVKSFFVASRLEASQNAEFPPFPSKFYLLYQKGFIFGIFRSMMLA